MCICTPSQRYCCWRCPFNSSILLIQIQAQRKNNKDQDVNESHVIMQFPCRQLLSWVLNQVTHLTVDCWWCSYCSSSRVGSWNSPLQNHWRKGACCWSRVETTCCRFGATRSCFRYWTYWFLFVTDFASEILWFSFEEEKSKTASIRKNSCANCSPEISSISNGSQNGIWWWQIKWFDSSECATTSSQLSWDESWWHLHCTEFVTYLYCLCCREHKVSINKQVCCCYWNNQRWCDA